MTENLADVQRLIDMEDEMILARDIAPILHIKPDVIIKYVKTGQWDADRLGNYVISGDHVKFFRKDFLAKCGFLQPDPEKPTQEEMFWKIWELLADIRILVKAIANDKTAGAATPTD